MSREEQRRAVRDLRESLIAQLEELYGNAFEKLASQNLGEGGIARLTQLLLRSREAAITPLREEIEAPLITTAPGTGEAATPTSAPGAGANSWKRGWNSSWRPSCGRIPPRRRCCRRKSGASRSSARSGDCCRPKHSAANCCRLQQRFASGVIAANGPAVPVPPTWPHGPIDR